MSSLNKSCNTRSKFNKKSNINLDIKIEKDNPHESCWTITSLFPKFLSLFKKPYPNNIAKKKQLLTHPRSIRRGNMEGGAITTKDMKVEINSSTEPENISPPSENVTTGGLARQGSMSKNSCLCSPTTHAGSFRCRLHRAPTMTNPNLQRTKSIESNPNKANPNAYTTS